MAVRDILIVEDQALARMYLCSCVEKCADCRVAGTLNRADAALRRCGDSHIDLILMDICTENDSDGLTAAEEIKKIYPRIKIVMVTSMLEGRFLARARKIGADSFWYKDSPSGDLVGVIEGTLSGKSYWPDSTPAVQLGNTLSCGLSDQELETLRLLCEGQTNAEIAAGMNVAESTVRTYINRMLEKTGYPNRNRLMVAAVSKRLVVPGEPVRHGGRKLNGNTCIHSIIRNQRPCLSSLLWTDRAAFPCYDSSIEWDAVNPSDIQEREEGWHNA